MNTWIGYPILYGQLKTPIKLGHNEESMQVYTHTHTLNYLIKRKTKISKINNKHFYMRNLPIMLSI